MELHNKVYLYYLTSPAERKQLKGYIWGDILKKNKLSKSEKQELRLLKNSEDKLISSNKQYWYVWINGTKGFSKRKIKDYYDDLLINSVFANQSNNTEDVTPKRSLKAKTIHRALIKNVKEEISESPIKKEKTRKVRLTRIERPKQIDKKVVATNLVFESVSTKQRIKKVKLTRLQRPSVIEVVETVKQENFKPKQKKVRLTRKEKPKIYVEPTYEKIEEPKITKQKVRLTRLPNFTNKK